MKILAQNRKARHNYHIISTVEAGLVLVGSEVKVLRAGQGSLVDAFAGDQDGRIVLHNFYVPPYKNAQYNAHEPRRERLLLLHAKEIKKMLGSVQKQGYTIVPLKVYLNKKGLIKVELALAKGKAAHDKRDTLKERDWKRQKERLLKSSS